MTKNDDEKVWAAYAKGVKPLKPARTPSPSHSLASASERAPPSPAARERGKAARRLKTAAKISGGDFRMPLDRNLERRMRQGAVEIEARIDLHGMRQDEAHEALHKFVAAHIKAGRRCLLVITGKGRKGPGVLRASLSGWLAASPLAAQILALRPASARHGGDGAFYVMLRRKS